MNLRKTLAVLLSAAMLTGLLPAPALAAEDAAPADAAEAAAEPAAPAGDVTEAAPGGDAPAELAEETEYYCGTDVRGCFDSVTGTLRITGTGEMSAYKADNESVSYGNITQFPPWKAIRESVREVIIDEGVTKIGRGAFADMTALVRVSIPSTVTKIDDYAFQRCASLVTLDIPGTVSTIGTGSFRDCSSLAFLNLHEGLKSISGEAFGNCDSLMKVTIPQSVTSLSGFSGCDSLIGINVSANVAYCGDIYGDSMQYIAVDMMNPYYQSVGGVLFDKDLKTLIRHPGGTAGACTVPYGVTEIAAGAFSYCRGLTAVHLPETVTYIGTNAFMCCSGLKSFVIPDSIPKIEKGTFADCTSLEELTIPASVVSFGLGAVGYELRDCLHSVRYLGTESQWKKVDKGFYNYFDELAENKCISYRQERELAVLRQPDDREIYSGGKVVFCATIAGIEPTYQWELKYPTREDWVLIKNGGYDPSLTVTAPRSGSGYLYRCVATDYDGNQITTEPAMLIVKPNPIVVTANPEDVTTPAKRNVTFSANAAGTYTKDVDGKISYLWEYREPGQTEWKRCTESSASESKLTVYATADKHGYSYRCRFYHNAMETAYSEPAVLTIEAAAPVIVTQPKDVSSPLDKTAKFTVAAVGDTLVYQWQYLAPSGTDWADTTLTGNRTPTLSVKASSGRDGYQYRCVVTDYKGRTAVSEPAALKVLPPAVFFTSQPLGVTAAAGSTARFTVGIGGETPASIQWQYKSPTGTDWANTTLAGNKTTMLSVAATEGRSGYYYRCVITDAAGNRVYSAPALLTVKAAATTVAAQPQSTAVTAGTTARFSVRVAGDVQAYQWQYKSPTGTSWASTTLSGSKTDTLSVPAITGRDGYSYRCKITDTAGSVLYSDAAVLTVQPGVSITAQPADRAVKAGSTAKFTVAASGEGLSYQWQYKSPTGTKWASTTLTGNKTATLSVAASAGRNGYSYRCKVTDAAGNAVYSEPAVLTVKAAITASPQSVTVPAGTTAQFTVSAAGVELSYQWQYKSPTGTKWASTTLSGNKTDTLSVSALAGRNGYSYRCKVTDAAGNTVYSAAAVLTVE